MPTQTSFSNLINEEQQSLLDLKRKWLKVVVVIFLIIVGAYFFLPKRTITVVGVGSESIQANRAQITFVYTASGANRNQALNTGEEGFTQLLEILSSAGASDVKRVSSQVQPITNVNNLATEYQYVSGATLKVENTQAIDSIMGILTSNNIQASSINYLPDNEKDAESRVQQRALDDAREKARAIARASGGRLGRVLAVAEQGSNASSGTPVTSVGQGADAASSSQVEIQSVVNVTYEMW